MMNKLKVWHLIGDKRAGGSNLLVKNLTQSSLKNLFEFTVLRLEEIPATFLQEKPDIIIFHYPCAWKYLLTLWRLKLHSKVYIYDHHYCQGFESSQVKHVWRFRLMLYLAYKLAQKVIAVSEAQRQWMIEAKLARPQKITVISPASPVASLLSIPPKVPEKFLILGAYGRFAPQKGFVKFLQLIPQILPPNILFYLGGYGQEEDIIQELAANLPHVKLMGPIADVRAFLAQCDGIVIPSQWEPFGLVCLEAKAAGRGVLVAAVDGLPEQVQGCGLALSLEDLEGWQREMGTLTPAQLAHWGQIGRQSVTQAWETCLQNWARFLSHT